MKRKKWVVLTISPTDTRYDKEAVVVSDRVKSVSKIWNEPSIYMWPSTMATLRRCLHDTRSSFIPVRLHPGSILSIYICLHDINQNCIPERVIPERLHPVVASDPNFRSRTKSVYTFHQCHVKEVQVHSGTEISKWIGWADQLTHVFDPSMLLQHFHSRMRTSLLNVKQTMRVVLEWNSFRYHVNTTLLLVSLVFLSVSLQCLKDGHDFFSRLLVMINVIDIFCTINRLFGQI